jgi:hypothetical protein
MKLDKQQAKEFIDDKFRQADRRFERNQAELESLGNYEAGKRSGLTGDQKRKVERLQQENRDIIKVKMAENKKMLNLSHGH